MAASTQHQASRARIATTGTTDTPLYSETVSLPSAGTLTLSVSLRGLWVAAAALAPVVGVAGKPGLLSPSLVFAVVGIPGSTFRLPELSALALTGFRSAVALVGHLRQGLEGCTAGRASAPGRHGTVLGGFGMMGDRARRSKESKRMRLVQASDDTLQGIDEELKQSVRSRRATRMIR